MFPLRIARLYGCAEALPPWRMPDNNKHVC